MPAFDPINVASLVITTISVAVTIYLFRRSIRKPVPTYSVHPLRVTILDKTKMTVSGLEVLHNGKPLEEGNLTAATVYFWNAGREPLRGSQVLTMYTIEITAPNVRILDWKVTPLREESKFSIPNGRPNSQSIHLLFEIVEHSLDAAEIQIIYTGESNAPISMSGVMVGAPAPKRKTLDDGVAPVSGVVVGAMFSVMAMMAPFFFMARFAHYLEGSLGWMGRGIALIASIGILGFAISFPKFIIVPSIGRTVIAKFAKKAST